MCKLSVSCDSLVQENTNGCLQAVKTGGGCFSANGLGDVGGCRAERYKHQVIPSGKSLTGPK